MDTDELELALQSWNRVKNSAFKNGYREGIEDGAESVYQDGYDKGYKEGRETAFILGQYKGLMTNMSDRIIFPQEIKSILSVTKNGSCYICKNNLRNQKNEIEKSVTEIINCQKTHSKQMIKIVRDFFIPILKNKGINIDLLTLQ